MADILHMADETLFSFSPKKDGDSLGLISYLVPNTRMTYKEDLGYEEYVREVSDRIREDLARLVFLKTAVEALRLSDKMECQFTPEQKETILSLIDRMWMDGKYSLSTKPWMKDDPRIKILETFVNHSPIFEKLDFHFNPPGETNRLSVVDHASPNFTTNYNSENIATDEAFPNMTKKILEDTPYMSDSNSFSYMPKDDVVGINSKMESNFSFSNNSNIALNDSIQIKHKRS
jgi:hypothetical protein